MPRRRREWDSCEDALLVPRRPFKHLHSAHRAAAHAEELIEPEPVDEAHPGLHHAAKRAHRNTEAVGLACDEIARSGAGRAHATAENVRANDEEPVRVDRLAGTDHCLPPAGLTGDGMSIGHMLVARQRMANEYRIRLVSIELAVSLIGLRERSQRLAA